MRTEMVKLLAYDFFNHTPHDDRMIGAVTTTIGMASMRASWKIVELYED
jgi:hypothetical protein